jgi:hypothetical protein
LRTPKANLLVLFPNASKSPGWLNVLLKPVNLYPPKASLSVKLGKAIYLRPVELSTIKYQDLFLQADFIERAVINPDLIFVLSSRQVREFIFALEEKTGPVMSCGPPYLGLIKKALPVIRLLFPHRALKLSYPLNHYRPFYLNLGAFLLGAFFLVRHSPDVLWQIKIAKNKLEQYNSLKFNQN